MSEPTFTPGPWLIATSNSWRRIQSRDGAMVCEPIIQRTDNHPDLHFRNGGPDGPDAALIAAAPDLYEALEMVRDADNDAKSEGAPGIPPIARAKIDAALAKASPQSH